MKDELHAARLVEEPLEDERVLRRNRSQHAASVDQVRQDLFRRVLAHPRLVNKPFQQRLGTNVR
jgi:hypothetical protein